jgi:uncharacterized protein (TIGR00255 family)
MVQSMTGFGSAEAGGFRVDIRSLNHRFMDVYMKLPPILARHEMAFREELKERFARGKFDVFVSVAGGSSLHLRANTAMAREVRDVLEGLSKDLGLSGEVGIGTLLHWKELFVEEEAEYDQEALFSAFRSALDELEGMRLKEGAAVAEEVLGLAARVETLNEEVAGISPAVIKANYEKFRRRLAELLVDCKCDDTRLLQEAAALAEKADITEELSRVRGHVEHMRSILAEGGAVGRKLDFLIQELHREANTMASKTDDSRVLESVIRMKAEIERTREQVQNIQ